MPVIALAGSAKELYHLEQGEGSTQPVGGSQTLLQGAQGTPHSLCQLPGLHSSNRLWYGSLLRASACFY